MARKIIIVGASSGIGRKVALDFAVADGKWESLPVGRKI